MSDNTKLELWAVVELMGHVKLSGRLTEEEHFGAKMGRIDVPVPCSLIGSESHQIAPEECPECAGKGSGFLTTFFGGASVYRITPVSEEVSRDLAKGLQPAPVQAWDYPSEVREAMRAAKAALSSVGTTSTGGRPGDGDEPEDDDDGYEDREPPF